MCFWPRVSGRERCGRSRQSPQARSIPCESTLVGGVGSEASLAWGLEGLKSYPLGKKDGILLGVSWEVSTDIPAVLGEGGVRSCSSIAPDPLGAPPPSITHAPSRIPWELPLVLLVPSSPLG